MGTLATGIRFVAPRRRVLGPEGWAAQAWMFTFALAAYNLVRIRNLTQAEARVANVAMPASAADRPPVTRGLRRSESIARPSKSAICLCRTLFQQPARRTSETRTRTRSLSTGRVLPQAGILLMNAQLSPVESEKASGVGCPVGD